MPEFSTRALRLAVIAAALCTLRAEAYSVAPTDATEAKPFQLKGGVDETKYFEDKETKMGIGVTKAKTSDTKGVLKSVRPGSAAARCGLRFGDRVVYENVRGSQLELSIERNGKVFQVSLSDGELQPGQPRMAPAGHSGELHGLLDRLNSGASNSTISGGINKLDEPTKKRLLASYDIVILIDKSGSMDTKDCPGGKSRWQWCAEQSYIFGQQYDDAAKREFSVVLFDHNTRGYEHTRFSDIRHIFTENRPSGNTNTARAVSDQITRLLGRMSDRPLVMAVITDGIANNQVALKQTLIRASSMTRFPNEVTVDFLQVGHDPIASNYLADLDSGLIASGAKSDIVDVQPFKLVQTLGLRDAILQSILNTSRPIKPLMR